MIRRNNDDNDEEWDRRVRLAHDERDFEPHERKNLRALLENWAASKQLWRMTGRIATVVGGVIVFMWSMRDPIARILRALGGEG